MRGGRALVGPKPREPDQSKAVSGLDCLGTPGLVVTDTPFAWAQESTSSALTRNLNPPALEP